MITSKEKVVKASFYIPVNYDKNICKDGVRNALIDLFGAFNLYELETKEITLEEQNAKN
jgi:hypothetical protein